MMSGEYAGRSCVVVFAVLICCSCDAVAEVEGPPRCAMILTGNTPSGRNIGTATLVSHGEQLYVVTVYHNLFNTTRADLTVVREDGVAETPISLSDDYWLQDFFYADSVNDLVVFKILPDRRDEFRNAYPDAEPIELYLNGDAPKGAPGVSIGNPQIDEKDVFAFRPQNVVYSCTLAEYEYAKYRIKSIIRENHKSTFAAADVKWLFVEALSIASGFSGGPVIVNRIANNSSGRNLEYRLAGIVSGGVPLVRPGRFAWAARAGTIENVIKEYEFGLAQRNLQMFPPTTWNEGPYDVRHSYSFDHQRQFKGVTFDAAIEDDRKVLANDAGYEFIFDTCTFRGDVFSGPSPGVAGSYLANARFKKCMFENTELERAILTGAAFENCEPFDRLSEMLNQARPFGVVRVSYADLEAPPQAPVKPFNFDELLRQIEKN